MPKVFFVYILLYRTPVVKCKYPTWNSTIKIIIVLAVWSRTTCRIGTSYTNISTQIKNHYCIVLQSTSSFEKSKINIISSRLIVIENDSQLFASFNFNICYAIIVWKSRRLPQQCIVYSFYRRNNFRRFDEELLISIFNLDIYTFYYSL